MRGKVTVQEIADMAGVSKFAVSRALSGKTGVSPQTREMIIRVAGQLGYFKQGDHRQLQGAAVRLPKDGDPAWSGTGTILVLFPNIRYQNKESLYWGPVSDGITARLNQKGLDILTLTEPSGDNLFSLLNPEAIKGVITVGAISTSILIDIGRLNIPVVMVDHLDPAFQCDTIFTDNFFSMKQIISLLVGKGYRNYQFVGNLQYAHSFMERWVAYRAALEEYQIPCAQIPSLIGPESDAIHDLFRNFEADQLPEVFVCVNDVTASFTIEALRAEGIQVPSQVVVTGFDNTSQSDPILATVNVNKELLGMRAVDQMLWRIMNKESNCEKKLIAADLIYREQYALRPSALIG